MTDGPSCHFLIVAAGKGARFGSELPKQYHEIAPAKSALSLCIERFQAWPRSKTIAIVAHPDYAALVEATGIPWVAGGATRQASVLSGLKALEADSEDFVFIHDAARPLVSQSVLNRLYTSLALFRGAVPALPIADTLKSFDPGEPETLKSSVDRDALRRVQTPQAFHLASILQAHLNFQDRQDFTDDASLLQAMGQQVALIEGQEQLMKITTALDFDLVQALYQKGY